MKRLFTLLVFLSLNTAVWAQLNCDNTLVCDDFDSYVGGALGPQADHWTTWSGDEGGTEDGTVNIDPDYAYSGNNSLMIQGESGPQDVVLRLGDQTSGNWKLEFKMFVFENARAYWNMQKCQDALGDCWGQEVYFAEDGTGSIDAGAANAATFTFPHDEWFDVVQFYDLDNDRSSLFIAGQPVHSWPSNESSQGTSNGLIQVGAIDFYAISAGPHLFYVDDVRFTQLPANDAASRIVQLTVDMSLEDTAPDGVFVAGSFNNFEGEPMEKRHDDLWQAFIPMPDATDMTYKFQNGTGGWEEVPVECGVGGYNDRNYFVDTSDAVLDTVCFSQCVSCDELSSVGSEILEAEFEIFPNPASDMATVSFQVETPSELQLRMVNLIGKSILEIEIGNATKGTERIDLGGIPSGVYFLQLHDGQRQISQKLVVD